MMNAMMKLQSLLDTVLSAMLLARVQRRKISALNSQGSILYLRLRI
jgi:hypothetical protein